MSYKLLCPKHHILEQGELTEKGDSYLLSCGIERPTILPKHAGSISIEDLVKPNPVQKVLVDQLFPVTKADTCR